MSEHPCDYADENPCWGRVEDHYPDDDDGCTTRACEGHMLVADGEPYLREEDKVPEPPRPPEQYAAVVAEPPEGERIRQPEMVVSIKDEGALVVSARLFAEVPGEHADFWPALNGMPVGPQHRRRFGYGAVLRQEAGASWIFPVEAGTYTVGLCWSGCEPVRVRFEVRTVTR